MCVATIELDELLMYKSPLLLPLFSVVFQRIYVKKVGGGVTPPGKLQLQYRFGSLSYWVCPSIGPSFTEIGEIACVTSAWSSGGLALNIICKMVSDSETENRRRHE